MPNASRRPLILAAWLLALLALGCHPSRAAAPALRDAYRRLIFEDRKAGELNATPLKTTEVGQNVEERIRITPEAGQQAVVRLLRPRREGRYPAVLIQHFLGGNKDDTAITFLLSAFASRGYVAAAIDGRYRGERGEGKSLPEAIGEALKAGRGRPWLIDTVFDDLRALDYLESRPDVDRERLGMAGVSEGGIETLMAAAADERIRCACSVIGVTRFQYIIEAAAGPAGEAYRKSFATALQEYARRIGEPEVNERVVRRAWEQLLPGFTDRFDAVNLAPLIAPRPFLILAHENDEIIPVKGAREVHEAARKRYVELDSAEKIQIRVAPGLKHAALDFGEVAQVYTWFDRWLRPSGGGS